MENSLGFANANGRRGPLSVHSTANKTASPQKSPLSIFKRVSADAGRPSKKSPATPLMMNPTAAWRMLCAKTGGGIALGTFYRWIRDGRVCAIRMGGKILVPAQILEVVIEKCLKGEDLL